MNRLTRRGLIGGLAATASIGRPSCASAEAGDRSAAGLVQALARRQVSARELLDAAIARIETLDVKVNAVVVRDFDRARAAAAEADAALDRGERRPLLGLPMTVKEQFNIAGLPTTWGYPRFKDWKPDFDALAVQRLQAAGAVILGKTNVPVGLSDWQSYNDVYGTTSNPWDLGRTPGGSSGGSAAALAAGFVSLELGSDIGGSLRAPAHFCGVFAHKPSIELIPQRGSGYPGTPPLPVFGDLAVIGPMARHAADLDLALASLAGPDEQWGGIGYRLELPPPRHERLADYRVLVLTAHPLCTTAVSVASAITVLADNLTKAGCTVLHTHSDMPDIAQTTRIYSELLLAALAPGFAAEQRARMTAAAEALAPEDRTLVAAELRGVAMNHAAWAHTVELRASMRARWQALLQSVDLILCPPMPTAAFPHDHSPLGTRQLDVDGRKISYDNQLAWSAVATMCGLPATVAPVGQSESGLPVGVQIIGGYLRDRDTIAFAALVQSEFGGFRRPPGFT